jgi:hypothetical protein
MKIGKFPKNISKSYLRRASVYRRIVGKDSGYDFSRNALVACYGYESVGGIQPHKNNGYYCGKRGLDITISNWIEDIEKGDFCKAEFYTPITRWYAEPALRNVIAPVWFPYQRVA